MIRAVTVESFWVGLALDVALMRSIGSVCGA